VNDKETSRGDGSKHRKAPVGDVMKMVLDGACGFFWTVTYLLIIRRGLADKTYGMPMVAITANISWEFTFSVLRPAPFPRVIAVTWLVLDLAILYTFLRFGRSEFPRLPGWAFGAMTVGTFILAFLGIWHFSLELDHGMGVYVAYIQNFMMSGLFVAMLLQRNSTRGQSSLIALAKLIGTALAGSVVLIYVEGRDSPLMIYLVVGIFVLDLVYLVALAMLKRNERSAAHTLDLQIAQDGLG